MTFKAETINLTSYTNNSTSEIRDINIQQWEATYKNTPSQVKIELFILIVAFEVVTVKCTQRPVKVS